MCGAAPWAMRRARREEVAARQGWNAALQPSVLPFDLASPALLTHTNGLMLMYGG